MSENRRTLFIGGGRHGQWFEVDDRLNHVELPRPVQSPFTTTWRDDLEPDFVMRTDLYSMRDLLHVAEHPCVRNAAHATFYRVAWWSDLPPDPITDLAASLHPIMRLVVTGPDIGQRRVGVPRDLDAPAWWVYPMPGGWQDPHAGVLTLPFFVGNL